MELLYDCIIFVRTTAASSTHSAMSTPPTIPSARFRCVTVFGGAGHQVGDPQYEEDKEVGRVIARRGLTLINGGYFGSMEATAVGVKEVGGQSFGIVVPSVFLERHQKLGGANKALTGVIETASIHDRIGILNSSSATFVILPGSIGTLEELITIWTEAQLCQYYNAVPPRIFAWRNPWENIILSLKGPLGISDKILTYITFIDGVKDLEKLL